MGARRAKIVATIGPASESLERLRELIAAGVDVARINMSHGSRERHAEVVARIRSVAAEVGKPLSIMLDLAGPKIRTGKLKGGAASLVAGAEVRLTPEQIIGDSTRFFVNYSRLAEDVKAGDRILIGDGEIELTVIGASGSDITARVAHGGELGEHKGVSLPGGRVSISSLTEKDLGDLKFGIEQGVDIVAQSFVRTEADCLHAREAIHQQGGNVRLIAKIEKAEAVDSIANILEVADGVMVARGDLAVETSPEDVPVFQKQIIAEGLLAQKTVITATQMLQSMIDNPRPTRAEASDVANAILDGSDALMLSGETAVGQFPVEAVKMMDRIIVSTEIAGAQQSSARLGPNNTTAVIRQMVFGQQTGSIGRAIAEAAAFAADELNTRLIVVFTISGHMARRLAALRPRQRIIALTPREDTHRQLALTWGVEPYPLEEFSGVSDEMLACGDRALLRYGLAELGETIVVMAGRMPDVAISTAMKLHVVKGS
jgi:pyruvate kinase